MRVHLNFDCTKWSAWAVFNCAECGREFDKIDEQLVHPTEEGWLKKRPIECINAGKVTANPHRNLELGEISK